MDRLLGVVVAYGSIGGYISVEERERVYCRGGKVNWMVSQDP